MEISIQFDTGNSAFEEDFDLQIIKIMDYVKKEILLGGESGQGVIYDFNGNNIGHFFIKK